MSGKLIEIDPIIGLRYSEATDIFYKYQIDSRIVKLDDREINSSSDIVQNRINLVVEHGVVVDYNFY